MVVSGRDKKWLFLRSVTFCNMEILLLQRHRPLFLVPVSDFWKRLLKSYPCCRATPFPHSSLYPLLSSLQWKHWVTVLMRMLFGSPQEESSRHPGDRFTGTGMSVGEQVS